MARPLRGNERRICFAKSSYGRFKEKGARYHCQFVLIQCLTPFFSQKVGRRFDRKQGVYFATGRYVSYG